MLDFYNFIYLYLQPRLSATALQHRPAGPAPAAGPPGFPPGGRRWACPRVLPPSIPALCCSCSQTTHTHILSSVWTNANERRLILLAQDYVVLFVSWKLSHVHLWGAVVRRPHPRPFPQPVAELLVNVDAWVWGSSWQMKEHNIQHVKNTGSKLSLNQSVGLQNLRLALFIFPVFSRSLTQWEDLPQQDAIGPHITLGGEHFVKYGLRGHPLQREASLSASQITGLQKCCTITFAISPTLMSQGCTRPRPSPRFFPADSTNSSSK